MVDLDLPDATLATAGVGTFACDLARRRWSLSPMARTLLGQDPDDETSDDEWATRLAPTDRAALLADLAACAASHHRPLRRRFPVPQAHDRVRWLEVRGVTHGDVVHGSLADVTELVATARALTRSNRTLRLLTHANQALARATDEPSLLGALCQLTVDVGGYRMVWVGLTAHDQPGAIVPVAHAGLGDGFVALGAPVWARGDDGPTARALASGVASVVRDVPGDPSFGPHRAEAARRGYGAAAALPFRVDGEIAGVLEVYAADVGAFDAEEVAGLAELAADVGVGLSMLRVRDQLDRASAGLADSNRRLEAAQQLAHVGHWEYDLAADRALWSDETYRLHDRPPHNPPVVRFSDEDQLRPVHPDDHARVRAAIAEALAGGPGYECRYRLVTTGGTVRHVHSRGEVRRDPDGAPRSFFGVMRDVTAEVVGQEALRAVEHQLRTFIDSLPDPVARFDRDGRLAHVGAAACRLLGHDPEQLLGRTPLELGSAPEATLLHAAVARVLATGVPEQRELEVETRAGRRPFEVRHVPSRDETGQLDGVVTIARDLTERRAAERQLYLLNYALDAAGDAIYLMADDSPAFLYVNQAAVDSLGYSRAELTGGMAVTDIDPGMGLREWQGLIEMIRQRRRATVEAVHRRRDGSTFPIEARGNYFEYDGRPYNMAVVRDISARRAEEAARQASEVRYQSLVAAMAEAVLVCAEDGRVIDANPAAGRVLGRPALALIDQRLPSGWFRGGPGEAPVEPIRAALAGDRVVEQVGPLHRLDGSTGWISVTALPLPRVDPGRPRTVLLTVHDLTVARTTEQQLQTVTAAIDEVFWLADPARTRFTFLSSSAGVFACPCMEGEITVAAWARHVHDADRARVLAAAAGLPDAGFDLEYRLCRCSGEVVWVHERAVAIRDRVGRVEQLAGVARDITARRRLEEQLHLAQKLEAAGQLAGGIAHDFNNVLTIIEMQASMLQQEPGAVDDVRLGADEILAACGRAANLTRQLLTFSRRQAVTMVDLDLGDTLSTMLKLLRRVLGEDIVLEARFAAGLPTVHADPGMMEQVLMNLALNARDAMPAGGRLVVELGVVPPSADEDPPGPCQVALTVTDTGVGIAPDDLERIFEPFFTTKEVGKGTGLGLATVFGIVTQHGGTIRAQSELGHGARFTVLLPATARPPDPGRPVAPRPSATGRETVLLVEDEATVRAMTRAALERHGYRVVETGDGPEALAAWASRADDIDLVVTDMIMPGGLSGHALIEQLRQQRPDLRVIYVSGYSPEVATNGLPLGPRRHFLAKPFAADELLALVRRCLDE